MNYMTIFVVAIIGCLIIYALLAFVASKTAGVKRDSNIDESKQSILNQIADVLLYTYEDEDTKKNVVRDFDGRLKRVTDKRTIKYRPKWEFNENHIVLICHEKIKAKQVEQSLKALGPELFERGWIPTPYLLLESTGVSYKFKLNFATQAEIRISDLLLQSGLTTKNSLDEVVKPSFTYNKDTGLIKLDCSQIPFAQKDIEKALPYFNTLGREYPPSKVKFEDNTYSLYAKERIDYLFDYKKPLIQQKEAILKIVDEMRKESKKVGCPVVFAGELYDSSFNVPSRIYIPLKDSPHSLTVGMTRSGKTKGALTELFFMSLAYSDFKAEGVEDWDREPVKFLFGDGQKSGSDFFPFLFNSNYNVATKDDAWTQPAIQLANLVTYAFAEYKKRKALASKHGVSTIAEVSKATGEKYPRIFLIVDEFAGFITSEGDKSYFKRAIGVAGTLPNKIRELLSAGASSGVHIWLLSQRYQDTDIPTEYRSNLTNGHFYAMELKDGANAELDDEFKSLPKGCYQLSSSGLFCADTSRSKIPLRLPYIGDNPNDVIQSLLSEEQLKQNLQDFNMDLIAQPDKTEFIKEEEILIRLKNTFLKNWTITKEESAKAIRASFSYIQAKKDDTKIAIGFVEDDEIRESVINTNLASSEADLNILFSISMSEGVIKKAELFNASSSRTQILPLNVYRKALVRDCLAQAEGEELSTWFDEYVAQIIEQNKNEVNEEASLLPDSKDASPASDNKGGGITNDDFEHLYDRTKVTEKTVTHIKSLPAKTDKQKERKGATLEILLKKMLAESGLKSYRSVELKRMGWIPNLKFGDSGVDVLAEINENEVVVYSCKNFAGGYIAVDAVRDLANGAATVERFSQKKVVKKVIVTTSESMSENARQDAITNNIQLVFLDDLLKLVREHRQKFGDTRGRPQKLKEVEAKLE